MVGKIREFLADMPKPLQLIVNVVFVFLLGIIDASTGYELSFSIFYLLPIAIVEWYVGYTPAILLSILSASVWLFADKFAGHIYPHFAIPAWNSVIILGFFLLTAYFLKAIKEHLTLERKMARTDPLTDIANIRYFTEKGEEELLRATRFHHPITIAYMDIDNFKAINDTYGHSFGDSLIKKVADILKENVRAIDIVARLGGDEFAILLPETGYNDAKAIIERIYKTILDKITKDGIPTTLSIGVISCIKNITTFDDLLKMADQEMYKVKETGKNRIGYKNIINGIDA